VHGDGRLTAIRCSRSCGRPVYSHTPLSKKLGIAPGARLHAARAPDDYRQLLGPLPDGVTMTPRLSRSTNLVHIFASTRGELARALRSYRRRLDPAVPVWVSWPKRAARVPTDLTEDVIRTIALPLGYVDVKVCAVSEIWSGLKLVVRKELR
jgi:hypothetical protein